MIVFKITLAHRYPAWTLNDDDELSHIANW
jgi:hypothetical protein